MDRARKAVQIGFVLIFVAFVLTPVHLAIGDILFRMDLTNVVISNMSTGVFTSSIIFVAALVIVTFLFGRFFCGWVCPLGTIEDFIDYIFGFSKRVEKLRVVKYHLLLIFLILSLAGFPLVWLLDPMTWASRIIVAFSPVAADLFLIYTLSAVLLTSHLLLGRRAFCRVLCPLGAALGLVSKFSLYTQKFNSLKCTDCGFCTEIDPSGAISSIPGTHHKAECIQCHQCDTQCPTGALSFDYKLINWLSPKRISSHIPTRRKDVLPQKDESNDQITLIESEPVKTSLLTRRAYLGTVGIGTLFTLWLHMTGKSKASTPQLLLPPGALPQDKFIKQCVRCNACIRICPTQTLEPVEIDNGFSQYQVPHLVARRGGCLYECNKCGSSCPNGAIHPLPLPEKRRVNIGIAVLNKSRCVPHVNNQPCMSCIASCPFEAISGKESGVLTKWGGQLVDPAVNHDRCTGCGRCEAACPLHGNAAIRIQTRVYHSSPEVSQNRS